MPATADRTTGGTAPVVVVGAGPPASPQPSSSPAVASP
jgi:hypothetical protein